MESNKLNEEGSRTASQNKITNEPHIRDEDSSDDSEEFNNFYNESTIIKRMNENEINNQQDIVINNKKIQEKVNQQ